MTNYQQLANELRDALAMYRPAVKSKQSKPPKAARTNDPAEQRKRHLAKQRECMARLRANLPKKFNPRIIKAKQFFPLLGELLGIGEAAARCRFYRHKIPADLVRQAKIKLEPINER